MAIIKGRRYTDDPPFESAWGRSSPRMEHLHELFPGTGPIVESRMEHRSIAHPPAKDGMVGDGDGEHDDGDQ